MLVTIVMFVVVNVVVMLNATTALVTFAPSFDICFHVKSCNLFLANGCVVGCK